jgi:hypothetical protein
MYQAVEGPKWKEFAFVRTALDLTSQNGWKLVVDAGQKKAISSRLVCSALETDGANRFGGVNIDDRMWLDAFGEALPK